MLDLSRIGAYLILQVGLCAVIYFLCRWVRLRLYPKPVTPTEYTEQQYSQFVFLLSVLIYIAGSPGITTTSDEDLLALVRAVSRGGTLEITEYSRSVHDAARRDDKFYSHKPPGVALIALPFYNFPRLFEPVLVRVSPEFGSEIVQMREGRFAVSRLPGPSTYFIALKDPPQLTRLRLQVHGTFAQPGNFLLSEIEVYDLANQPVPIRVESMSDLAGARPASETCDGDLGEDRVHGWPGASVPLTFPVWISWQLESPVVPARVELAQLSPFRDHTIRSFNLFGEDDEGQQHVLTAQATHIRPSTVDWGADAACSAVAIVSAIGVFLLFRLLRSFGVERIPATVLALLFAFGTLQWRYGAVLYNHTLLAACVLGALYGLRRTLLDPQEAAGWWLLSWSLAWGILADIIFLIVWVVCLGSVLPTLRRIQGRRLFPPALPPFAGLILLGVYQWICFGKPWAFPQQFSHHHAWLGSVSTAFDFPTWKGLWILLFHQGPLNNLVASKPWINADLSRSFSGLFAMSPYLLFALLGLPLFFRDHRRFAVAALLIFVVTLVAMASFRTPWAGDDYDVRYIHHVIPILFLPLGLWLTRLPRSTQNRILLYGIPFIVAVALGVMRNIFHLADGPGREDMVVRLGVEWMAMPSLSNWRIAFFVGPPLIALALGLKSPPLRSVE